MTEFVADVIIVGAGPCGLFVGCELAQAGVKVLILEKRSGPTLPRAGNLQPRVLKIFDCRGLAEGVEARARELHSKPRASIGIWAGFPGVRYDVLETRFPYMLFLAQIETKNILAERFLQLGGEIRLQHEVTTLTQDHCGVHIDCIGPDGSHQTLGSRYAVGAHGARSTVRDAVGIACLCANQMNHSYTSRLGPIPLDHFDNDTDPSIMVNKGPGSVYAKVMKRIEQSNRGRKEPQPK